MDSIRDLLKPQPYIGADKESFSGRVCGVFQDANTGDVVFTLRTGDTQKTFRSRQIETPMIDDMLLVKFRHYSQPGQRSTRSDTGIQNAASVVNFTRNQEQRVFRR